MSALAENDSSGVAANDFRRKKIGWLLIFLVLVFVGITTGLFWKFSSTNQPDIEVLLEQAQAAYERRDYQAAERDAQSVLKTDPKNPAALLLIGKCLEAEGYFETAVKSYAHVPAGHPPYSTEAAWRAGRLLLLKLGRLSEAERFFLQALKEDPNSQIANEGLAALWGVSGQWWRQIPAQLRKIQQGTIERVHLYSLALAENSLDLSLDLDSLKRDRFQDPLVLMASARRLIADRRYSSAETYLKQVTKTSPEIIQAYVSLGKVYLELKQYANFGELLRSLPSQADDHPDTWFLRGQWAVRNSRDDVALRCFCEAVFRDPNHLESLYRAGRLLTKMRQSQQAARFLNRAKLIQDYLNVVIIAGTDGTVDSLKQASALAETLGNIWEAYGWAVLMSKKVPQNQWSQKTISRLKPRLRKLVLERTGRNFNPARRFEFQSFPLPSHHSRSPSIVRENASDQSASRISLADVANASGLQFRYFNGSQDVSQGLKFMQEVMGGGVAVLDLNGDLLPDLYFSQGCRWPVDETRFEHLDRVFLNRGNGEYVDVTAQTGIRENRFGQGVTVGDFNSDGFPDLFVANIGRNRLYRNNGDGTFTDVSEEIGLTRGDWSTSCAIADLNGDGHPEIYVVNYLKGQDIFTRNCLPKERGNCVPHHFAAANDRLFWNRGDGRFQDVTNSSGILRSDGKGLGIVVGRLNQAKSPGIFIANDTTHNFYFENQMIRPGAKPIFAEQALVMGLAVNDEGRAQACMGVAAGDADGDGFPELFVTNFHGESNSYYKLEAGGYRDVARLQGLRIPSLSMLGFGTQFVDADLDGWLDLIVANGHINDYRNEGRADYQMRPQFFQNSGKGHFREIKPRELGVYFQGKWLGRAMARLDWNDDGQNDVVISHLDRPVALLENKTDRQERNFFKLFVRGVQSSRDAIGTIVKVETTTGVMTRQLMAGDGFQASNEKVLIFGLGNQRNIKKLTIIWPSGTQSEFRNLNVNSRWLAVEGVDRLFSLPGSNPNQ
ncbi:MAG: FG-GAP-like repeat-containing protein [Planctomycetaceae bacterium]